MLPITGWAGGDTLDLRAMARATSQAGSGNVASAKQGSSPSPAAVGSSAGGGVASGREPNVPSVEEALEWAYPVTVRCPRCTKVTIKANACLLCNTSWAVNGEPLPVEPGGVYAMAASAAVSRYAIRLAAAVRHVGQSNAPTASRSVKGLLWRESKACLKWRRKWAGFTLAQKRDCASSKGLIPQLANRDLAPVGWYPESDRDRPQIYDVWARLLEEGRDAEMQWQELIYRTLANWKEIKFDPFADLSDDQIAEAQGDACMFLFGERDPKKPPPGAEESNVLWWSGRSGQKCGVARRQAMYAEAKAVLAGTGTPSGVSRAVAVALAPSTASSTATGSMPAPPPVAVAPTVAGRVEAAMPTLPPPAVAPVPRGSVASAAPAIATGAVPRPIASRTRSAPAQAGAAVGVVASGGTAAAKARPQSRLAKALAANPPPCCCCSWRCRLWWCGT